jgi:hypothetical protein
MASLSSVDECPGVGQFRNELNKKLPAQKTGGLYKGNPHNGDVVL